MILYARCIGTYAGMGCINDRIVPVTLRYRFINILETEFGILPNVPTKMALIS